MKKRVFAAICAVVLLVAMSTTVLAAPGAGTMALKPLTWTRWVGGGNYLTLVAAAADGNPVRLSGSSTTNAGQIWMLKTQQTDGSYRMYTGKSYNAHTGRGYTLNIRSGMCTVLYDNPSNRSDSEVDLNSINGAANLYRIKLPYYNVYLQNRGAGNQCSWEYYAESSAAQKWTAVLL